jgi:hypothetical protein
MQGVAAAAIQEALGHIIESKPADDSNVVRIKPEQTQ